MTSATTSLRGIAAMLFATASYVVRDTFMKLVMKVVMPTLPPFEVLFVRAHSRGATT